MKDAVKEESDSEIDDEKTGGEWVTAENLYRHVSKGDSEALVINQPEIEITKSFIEIKEGAPKHVVFLTSDYAM